MRVLSAALLAVVACAHVERHPTDVERRLAALEARTDWRAVPQEEFYRSLRAPSGIFYASAPMSRINPPSFLLGQGAAVGEGGNCAEPSAGCRAASFSAGNGTAALPSFFFTSDQDTGMYLAGANTVGLGGGGLGMISIAPGVTAGGLITGVGTAAQLRLDASTGWQGSFNGSSLTLDSNAVTIRNNASGQVAVVVNAASGQSVDIQDWKVNGGAVLASIGSAGLGTFAGVVLSSTTSPLTFNAAPGTAGQVALSAGAGATPTWGTVDQTFCVYNTGALAGATAFGQTKFTHSATVDTSSTIAQDVAGTGAGNFVVKVCTDGATCAGGNTFLTYTEACTAAAGVITAATVQNSGAIPANSTVTVSVATACGPDPAANVCIHYTTP